MVRRFHIDKLPTLLLFRDRKVQPPCFSRAPSGGTLDWGGCQCAARPLGPCPCNSLTPFPGPPFSPPLSLQMYVVPESAHSQEGLREFLLQGYESAHSMAVPPDTHTFGEFVAALRSHLVRGWGT